jgi:hypothetical protein
MNIISPTHKRTEGRARCGSLSLLQKILHYRGDPAETVAGLNAKLWVLVVRGWWWRATAFEPNPLFESI